MYTEDEMLMLSGIQHYMLCPRQWAFLLREEIAGHLETQLMPYFRIYIPFLYEKILIGLLPYVQACYWLDLKKMKKNKNYVVY